MTDGLQSGVTDAVKVTAGIGLYLVAAWLTEKLHIQNQYLLLLIALLQTVLAAILVAGTSAAATGIFNRAKITLEWRQSEGGVAAEGRPSFQARGQTVNLQLVIEGNSLRARLIRRRAATGHLNIVLKFGPEQAVNLRIESQVPRRFSVRGDCILIQGLKMDIGRACHANISIERADNSSHPLEVNLVASTEWSVGNRAVCAILKRSVRINAGVSGFDMRGVT